MTIFSDNPEKPGFEKDDLVCFCFEHTRNDIEQDYINNGRSLIMDKILAAKKLDTCKCATKNPRGRWCLTDVCRVVDMINSQNIRPTRYKWLVRGFIDEGRAFCRACMDYNKLRRSQCFQLKCHNLSPFPTPWNRWRIISTGIRASSVFLHCCRPHDRVELSEVPGRYKSRS